MGKPKDIEQKPLDASLEYLDELKEEVKKLEKSTEASRITLEEIERRFNLTSYFDVPWEGKHPIRIYSNEFRLDYDTYKEHLRFKWADGRSKKVINEMLEQVLFITAYTFTLYFIWMILPNLNLKFLANINLGLKVGLILLGFELVSLVITNIYFIVRPNSINRSIAKRDIKKRMAQLALDLKTLESKKSLIEMTETAYIYSQSSFGGVKAITLNTMKKLHTYTVEEVLPNIDDKLQVLYSTALGKCETILSMAKENRNIVRETSKIFNIHLQEINTILKTVDGKYSEDIADLISNFSAFLGRKIENYNAITMASVKISIDALNSEFKEEY